MSKRPKRPTRAGTTEGAIPLLSRYAAAASCCVARMRSEVDRRLPVAWLGDATERRPKWASGTKGRARFGDMRDLRSRAPEGCRDAARTTCGLRSCIRCPSVSLCPPARGEASRHEIRAQPVVEPRRLLNGYGKSVVEAKRPVEGWFQLSAEAEFGQFLADGLQPDSNLGMVL